MSVFRHDSWLGIMVLFDPCSFFSPSVEEFSCLCCYGVGFYAILCDLKFLTDELSTQVQTYDK